MPDLPMHRLAAFTILAGSFALSACSPPDPSTAAERIVGRYLESTAGIESFAVVSDEITVYHQLSDSDSLRIYRPVAVSNGAPGQPLIDPFRFPAVPRLAIGLRKSGVLDSTFTLDDNTRVIAYTIEEPGVMLAPNARPMSNVVTKLQLLVDASTFDIRRIHGTFSIAGYERPVQEIISYNAYEEVDSMRLPSQTVVRVKGLDQMFTEDQKLIMQGRLIAEREKAKLLPPSDRQEVLDAVREQEVLLNEGIQETRFDVEEVRVGEPIPDRYRRMPQGAPSPSPAPADSSSAVGPAF